MLITVTVAAPSLSTELLRGSQRPGELLTRVADTARRVQRALGAGNPAVRATLLSRPHSSIAGTYARKFLSPRHARDYLTALGEGWVSPTDRREIQESLTKLRSVLSPLLRPIAPPMVIYGDLKPEHVLLEPAGSQTWIDPGLQRADPATELAKLVSRTALLLVTTQSARDRTSAILDALDQVLTNFLRRHARAEMDTLRRVLVLWLADWSNTAAILNGHTSPLRDPRGRELKTQLFPHQLTDWLGLQLACTATATALIFPRLDPGGEPRLDPRARTVTISDFFDPDRDDRYPDFLRLTRITPERRDQIWTHTRDALAAVPHHSAVLTHDTTRSRQLLATQAMVGRAGLETS